MPVKHIKSSSEFRSQLAQGSNLIVVDFFATWCGPCKRISPFLEQLSNEMSNVVFLKVDVDELEEIAREENISAMPTFYLYKNGKKIADLVGADQARLKSLIEQHA